MPKTLNMVWLHVIWSTKNREPLIRKYFRGALNNFLKEYAFSKKIQLDTVNGMPDHIHILLKLSTTQNIADVVGLLKGASSKWLNDNYYPSEQFNWQEGYGVFSVSRHEIIKIRKYIYNQEKHHISESFEDEIKTMINN